MKALKHAARAARTGGGMLAQVIGFLLMLLAMLVAMPLWWRRGCERIDDLVDAGFRWSGADPAAESEPFEIYDPARGSWRSSNGYEPGEPLPEIRPAAGAPDAAATAEDPAAGPKGPAR